MKDSTKLRKFGDKESKKKIESFSQNKQKIKTHTHTDTNIQNKDTYEIQNTISHITQIPVETQDQSMQTGQTNNSIFRSNTGSSGTPSNTSPLTPQPAPQPPQPQPQVKTTPVISDNTYMVSPNDDTKTVNKTQGKTPNTPEGSISERSDRGDDTLSGSESSKSDDKHPGPHVSPASPAYKVDEALKSEPEKQPLPDPTAVTKSQSGIQDLNETNNVTTGTQHEPADVSEGGVGAKKETDLAVRNGSDQTTTDLKPAQQKIEVPLENRIQTDRHQTAATENKGSILPISPILDGSDDTTQLQPVGNGSGNSGSQIPRDASLTAETANVGGSHTEKKDKLGHDLKDIADSNKSTVETKSEPIMHHSEEYNGTHSEVTPEQHPVEVAEVGDASQSGDERDPSDGTKSHVPGGDTEMPKDETKIETPADPISVKKERELVGSNASDESGTDPNPEPQDQKAEVLQHKNGTESGNQTTVKPNECVLPPFGGLDLTAQNTTNQDAKVTVNDSEQESPNEQQPAEVPQRPETNALKVDHTSDATVNDTELDPMVSLVKKEEHNISIGTQGTETNRGLDSKQPSAEEMIASLPNLAADEEDGQKEDELNQ